jgi:hypothetical protein
MKTTYKTDLKTSLKAEDKVLSINFMDNGKIMVTKTRMMNTSGTLIENLIQNDGKPIFFEFGRYEIFATLVLHSTS